MPFCTSHSSYSETGIAMMSPVILACPVTHSYVQNS
jgi:hypothetical protein